MMFSRAASTSFLTNTPDAALFLAVLACACFRDSGAETSLCESSPCQNGGVCNQVLTTYYCDCPDTYDGRDCQLKLAHPKHVSCKSSPCINGGTCHQLTHTYYCECPSNYRGSNCESKLEPREHCQSSPCKNGGTCYDLLFTYYCECPRHYHGNDCQIREVLQKHSCDSSPCKNGGTCQELDFTYRCVCREGFLGFNCEVENVLADYCSSFPCQNGGVCHNTELFRYICVCAKDYRGRTCELKKYSTPPPFPEHHGDAGFYPLDDPRAVSAVATAGIYSGVALGCVGVVLIVFLFWRRKCVMLAMCYDTSDDTAATPQDHLSNGGRPPEYSSLLPPAVPAPEAMPQRDYTAAVAGGSGSGGGDGGGGGGGASGVGRDRPPSYRTATQVLLPHACVARSRQTQWGWTVVKCGGQEQTQDGAHGCDGMLLQDASTQAPPLCRAVQEDVVIDDNDSEPPPSYEEAIRDSNVTL